MKKRIEGELDRRMILERTLAVFGGFGLFGAGLGAAGQAGTTTTGLDLKQGVRRIITGHNAQGRSYIIKDDRITTGPFPSLYKATGDMPLVPAPAGEPQKIMPTDAPQLEPALGGSSFTFVTLPPTPRGAKPGSRLPELTQRAILMLKADNPEWGCQRISDALARGPALPASAGAVSKVLHEAGYELEETPTHPHPDKPRFFERAAPNQLWQSDLFTFMLKRQNRRVYLVAFLDDHSRYLVSYGLHASGSSALVLEVLRAGIASYQAPEEILTDNGSQYVTWRGTSAFARECQRRGIKQVVATPRHPQTLGKIERFWGTLWREWPPTRWNGRRTRESSALLG